MAVNYIITQTNEIKDSPYDFSVLGVSNALLRIEASTSSYHVQASFFSISGGEPFFETTEVLGEYTVTTRKFRTLDDGINLPDEVDEVWFQDSDGIGVENNHVKVTVVFKDGYAPSQDTSIVLDIDGDAQEAINYTQTNTPYRFQVAICGALPTMTGIDMPSDYNQINAAMSSQLAQILPLNDGLAYPLSGSDLNPPSYCHLKNWTVSGNLESENITGMNTLDNGATYLSVNKVFMTTPDDTDTWVLGEAGYPTSVAGLGVRQVASFWFGNAPGGTPPYWGSALGDGTPSQAGNTVGAMRFIYSPAKPIQGGNPLHSLSRHNFSYPGSISTTDETSKSTTYSNPIVFLGYENGYVQVSDIISSLIIRDVISEVNPENVSSWPSAVNYDVPDVTQSDIDNLSTYGLSPYDWVNNKVEITVNGLEDYVPGDNPPDIYILMDIKPMLLEGNVTDPSITYDLNININGETT